MSYPFETTAAPGLTIYAVLHHPDGRVWNDLSEAWETFNAGNWALYAIPLTEQGASGYYRGEFPTATIDILATSVLYSQGGGTPAQADAPGIGIGQSQGFALVAIADSTRAVDNLKANLEIMVQGAAIAGTLSTTQMTTNLTDASDGVYAGRLLIWTDGSLLRRAVYIQAYDGNTKKLTFGSMPVAPIAGDQFIII